MSIAVVAGLVYGAYVVNLKYFGGNSSTQQKQTEFKMVPFVCPRDIQAFDPASPKKLIGQFNKGTQIDVGINIFDGMKNVSYQQPNGQTVRALCRAKDLTGQPADAPLEKMQVKTKLAGNPALKDNPDATWLGNGQMTIQQGENGGVPGTGVAGSFIPLGKSGAKEGRTLSGSFEGQQDSTPPPSPSLSPEQGIKQRAKDLGTNQGSASP